MADPQVAQLNPLKKLLNKSLRWLRDAMAQEPPGNLYADGVNPPTIELQAAIADRAKLQGLLPYESYDEEKGLYFNQGSYGFIIYALPAMGISEERIRILNGIFTGTHLPQTCIQVSLIADANIIPMLEHWRDRRGKDPNNPNTHIFKRLAQSRLDYWKSGMWSSLFSDQAYLLRDYHLIISYSVPVDAGIGPDDISESDLDLIVRTKDAFKGIMKSVGIIADDCKPERFINLMNGLLNPSKDRHPHLRYEENRLISDQMADANTMLLVGRDGSSLVRDDFNISVLPWSVRQFPEAWFGGANGEFIGSNINNILRVPCPFIQTLFVYIPDQTTQKGRIKAKVARATQMMDSPMGRFVPQWKERHRDWQFVEQKVNGGDKLLEALFQIVLFPIQGKEQESEQALRALFNSFGWVLQKDRFIPIHGFMAALPMWTGKQILKELKFLGRFKAMLSWNATNVAPILGEWKGTRNPLMMLSGRRGQVAFVDPFDNDKGNYNISMAAASGAGKSFITQDFIMSSLATGGRGFVIDSGRSYENLCHLLNGTYLDFGKTKPVLNPFSSIEDIEEGMSLVKLLVSEMASPEKPLESIQRSFVEKAVVKVWAEHGKESTITKVAEALEVMEDARAKDVATMLYPYTVKGMYGRYFEGPSNIDFSNQLVVLELDDLNSKPDLQAVVLLMLMFKITQTMYLSDRRQRKFCIIDEAWRLLGRGNAGDFIEEGYRVVRKYGGSFMTVTQKVDDYYASAVSQAAYMNSDWVWLLRQKPESLSAAEKNGWLDNSGGRVDLYRTLDTIQHKYSEVAMISPAGVAILRFIVEPMTEKLYSTKAEEVQFIKDKQKEGKSLFDALEELVKVSDKR